MLIKPVLKEQAELQRIQRGYASNNDKLKFYDVKSMQAAYPEFTKSMTRAELEILLEKMQKIVGLFNG